MLCWLSIDSGLEEYRGEEDGEDSVSTGNSSRMVFRIRSPAGSYSGCQARVETDRRLQQPSRLLHAGWAVTPVVDFPA